MLSSMLRNLCFVILIIKNNGFNIDTSNPIIFQDPKTDIRNYFGYSVVSYPDKRGDQSGLFIASPRESYSTAFNYSGVIYKCLINQGCSSFDLNLDLQAYRRANLDFANGFLGGSMDINNENDLLITSAFHSNQYVQGHMAKGFSFSTNLRSSRSKLINPFENYLTYDEVTIHGKAVSIYTTGLAQAGFSVHIPKNTNDIIMGSPGYYLWTGIALRVVNNSVSNIIVPKFHTDYKYDLFGYAVSSGYFYKKNELNYVMTSPRANNVGQVVIFNFPSTSKLFINEKEKLQGTQLGAGFGYSVATGDINNDGLDDIIVGAPYHRIKDYNEGKMYVYLGSETERIQKAREGEYIEGKFINGQFGLSVMYLNDINKDGYGDVAVSAPFQDDHGTVYIYKGTKFGLYPVPSQIIFGKDIYPSLNGFGYGFSKPVDLDSNNVADLAIGSFKSGNVVVLRGRPVVVVTTSLESDSPILERTSKTYAVIARYKYTEFTSDTSIKIRRIITVDEELGRARINGIQQNKEITVQRGVEEIENITIFIKDTKNYNDPLIVSLTYKLVDEQENKNGSTFIKGMMVNSNDRFCIRCPVLDVDRSTGPIRYPISFQLGCGSDNICDSNLELDLKIIDLKENNTYIVGTKDYLKLQATLVNQGEKAYSTEMDVILQDLLSFRKIPSNCEASQNQSEGIHCNIKNPVEEKELITNEFDLDLRTINTGDHAENVSITVRVATTSNNKNRNLEKHIILNLQREADIYITGYSGEQSYSYGNATDRKPKFTQTYQVEKTGASPIEKARVEIQIPYALRASGEIIPFLTMFQPEGQLSDQVISCNSHFEYLNGDTSVEEIAEVDIGLTRRKRQVEVLFNNSTKEKENIQSLDEYAAENRTFSINCSMENVLCDTVVCLTGPYHGSANRAVIQLKMVFDESAIAAHIGKNDLIIIQSFGDVIIEIPNHFVQTGNRPDNTVVSTLFVGDAIHSKISLWIILIAVVIGFLLLLVLIFVLIKAGFFKRSKKEKLDELKARASAEMNVNIQEEVLDTDDDVFRESIHYFPEEAPLSDVNDSQANTKQSSETEKYFIL